MEQSKNLVNLSPRLADEFDLEQLIRIESQVHLAPWTLEQFRSEIAKPYSQTWVLTDDETDQEIYSYVVGWKIDGCFRILNVATDPSRQRQGHARQLLVRIFRMLEAEGIQRMELEVRVSNTPAIQLYQQLGFSINSVRKRFYSNGEDAYAFSRSERPGPVDF
jgi:ribosomal-protein-alanine N-acetyltransferase